MGSYRANKEIHKEMTLLGFGLGLRTPHYKTLLEAQQPVDWFEIISENYMIPGGKNIYYLDKIREIYPIVMHGVSLSIGSCDELNWEYLKQLKLLIHKINPKWVSDHLCWTGINNINTHDLLPLPFTEESLAHVIQRVKIVQDYLERKILLENVSSYVSFKDSSFSEWEFLKLVAEESDCHILLDLNNIYVSSFNHGFEALEYLNALPVNRVKQFHLAGHLNKVDHIIDTHDAAISDPVWSLYKQALKRFGNIPTLIERDDNIPPLATLIQELNFARNIAKEFFQDKFLNTKMPIKHNSALVEID